MLNNIVKLYNEHKAVSYDVNYSVKPFSKDAPFSYNVHCSLIRDTKDTLFCGYIWHACDNFGGFENYYNLSKIYHISDSLRKITEYNDTKTQYWAMTGNFRTKRIIFIF